MDAPMQSNSKKSTAAAIKRIWLARSSLSLSLKHKFSTAVTAAPALTAADRNTSACKCSRESL